MRSRTNKRPSAARPDHGEGTQNMPVHGSHKTSWLLLLAILPALLLVFFLKPPPGSTSTTVSSSTTTTGTTECNPDALVGWLRNAGATINPLLTLKGKRGQYGVFSKDRIMLPVPTSTSTSIAPIFFSVPDNTSLTAATVWERRRRSKAGHPYDRGERIRSMPFVTVPPGSLRTVYIQDDKTAYEYTNLAAALLVERNAGTAGFYTCKYIGQA